MTEANFDLVFELAELSDAYRAKCDEVLEQDKLIRSANKELKQVDLELHECQEHLELSQAQNETDVENIMRECLA